MVSNQSIYALDEKAVEEGAMEVEDDDVFPWQIGLADAHCHPTDTLESIPNIQTMNASVFTIMATRNQDQHLVSEAAESYSIPSLSSQDTVPSNWRGVVPSFGFHPWFSYQKFDDTKQPTTEVLKGQEKVVHYRRVLTPEPTDEAFLHRLPDPQPLSGFLEQTEAYLSKHATALVGEIGLDKAFRLPRSWLPQELDERDTSLTPGGREGRLLSPYRVQIDHQIAIFVAQVNLAAKMQRSVSVHGVQAHGIVYESLKSTWKEHTRMSKRARKRQEKDNQHASLEDEDFSNDGDSVSSTKSFPPRVCLHSYSGPVEFVRQYVDTSVPVIFYFSFSIVINFSTPNSSKAEEVIRAVPDDRILVESDMHIAGESMDANLEAIARKVCALKGWALESGTRQLARNWRHFVFGNSKEDGIT